MSDLFDLYQEVILDHSKRPRNFRILEHPNRHAMGFNPLCGDQIELFLLVEKETILELTFQGTACAICTSSTSLMTEFLHGKSETEAREMFDIFRTLLVKGENSKYTEAQLGPMAPLYGVRRFPMRVKCATLPWHTMLAALNEHSTHVSTE